MYGWSCVGTRDACHDTAPCTVYAGQKIVEMDEQFVPGEGRGARRGWSGGHQGGRQRRRPALERKEHGGLPGGGRGQLGAPTENAPPAAIYSLPVGSQSPSLSPPIQPSPPPLIAPNPRGTFNLDFLPPPLPRIQNCLPESRHHSNFAASSFPFCRPRLSSRRPPKGFDEGEPALRAQVPNPATR